MPTRFSWFLAAALIALPAFAQAPPPRSVADVLAILDQHKPDPEKVSRLRELVASQPPDANDKVLSRRFYVERGEAAAQLGLLKQSLADLRQAFDLLAPSDPDRWFVYVLIGGAELQAGNVATAVKMWKELPAVSVNDGQRITSWATVSSSAARIGDLAAARDAFGRAQSLLATLNQSPAWRWYSNAWRAQAERARVGILRLEGKHADAEIAARQALTLMERHIELYPVIAANLRQVAIPPLSTFVRVHILWQVSLLIPSLLEQGKYAEAELSARDGLKRALEFFGKYSPETGSVVAGLAFIVFEQGRFDESTVLAKAALDIYAGIGAAPYSSTVVRARRTLGAALVEAAKYAEADVEFQALHLALKESPESMEILGTGSLAGVYALVRLGKTAEAVEQARSIYEFERQRYGDALFSVVQARGYYALALAADRRYEEALREFRAAIPPLLAALSERTSEEGVGIGRTLRLTRILDAYIALLGHFASLPSPPAGLDPVAEAFLIADTARGSTVQRALTAASARSSIREPELAKLAREEQDSAHRVASLTGILVDLLARPAEQQLPTVIANIRRDIDAFRKQRRQLMQEIEKRFPDYANLIDPKPVTLEAARRTLVAGEALIVLYGTDEKTFIWAVPREGQPRFHSAALGRKERDALVASLQRAFDVGERPLVQFPKFDTVAAHKLHSELLAPVEPAWAQASSLLIVPHGSLGQLPFGLLVTKPSEVGQGGVLFDGYKRVDWLIRRAAVTQLPSVNTLSTLRSVARARAPAKAFMGFGDPVFGPQQVARAGGAVTRGVKLRSATFSDPAARTALSARLAMLAPLPDTAEELEGIAKVLGASGPQALFLGARATEAAVKGADLSDLRVVAFATHGLVPGDLDGLTQPALALSNPELSGDKDNDGLLGMDEILALKLNADWVVLSACNTASSGGASEEAISGLGRAFFFAGARALLVSNWPVETVSAKLLTTDIFRRQAANPKLARAEALRQAMLDLMDNQSGRDSAGNQYSYAHPLFWAPFSLVGDGR